MDVLFYFCRFPEQLVIEPSVACGEGATSFGMTRPFFPLIQKNTYNLAEPEVVLKCSRMLLKSCGRSQLRRSYRNGSHLKLDCVAGGFSWFLTRRLRKQSKGFSGGADHANDMQMISFHHL